MRRELLHHLVIVTLAFSIAAGGSPLRAYAATGPRCYVDASKGGGGNDGNSWPSAYTALQSALADANCTEIWVAAGVYKPGSARADKFQIGPGKAVYGGFAGTESDRNSRNWTTNVTTLSGDIGAPGSASDNSYHVVFMDGVANPITSTTVLDGFTITGGNANGAITNDRGGGLYCYGPLLGHQCSPTLANLIFSGNAAISFGGALFNDGSGGGLSSPSLTNVSFQSNAVTGSGVSAGGGAVFNYFSTASFSNVTFSGNSALFGGAMENSGSNATLTNVAFSGNSAMHGGALYNNSSAPGLTSVDFSSNTAAYVGGAMYNYASSPTLSMVNFTNNSTTGIGTSGGDSYGGAIYNEHGSVPNLNYVTFVGNSAAGPTAGGAGGAILNDDDSGMVLTNATFSGNSATNGGGVFNKPTTKTLTLTNATFDGNTATAWAGALFNQSVSPHLTNVTFSGNSATYAGGIFNTDASAPSLMNVTFSGNSATYGGGMYDWNGSNPTLTNVILWGDSASAAGPEIFNGSSTPTIDHSVVQGGCASTGSNCGSGNLGTDPRLAPLGDYGGPTQTMALLAGSSALDSGTNSGCPGTDQRGVTRPQGSHCDIGAYEFDQPVVNVNIGGSPEGTYAVAENQAQQQNYAGVNTGPALVTNSTLGPVASSIRVIYAGNSYSEMMGYPNKTTTQFWFPWYNNTAMDSQFRVSNLGGSSTTITVSLAGSPIDSFTLGAGAAIRKNYPGQNNGPMQVASSGGVPILSTIRVLFGGSSYSEMMGFPNNATSDFWFPWYNNVAMDSQFRVSNLGGTSTTITVSLGGSPIDSFTLPAGAAIRKNYAGQNNGPMQVSSSATPILATIRVLYGGSSYSEMMGFPDNTTTDFWFPWYDNVGADSQFRVSNLGGSSTTITVSLAGTTIDSFSLGAGAAVRKNYSGANSGTLHVSSSGGTPILSTVRIVYGASSYYELMGYPGNQLTSTQYFPWYNNTAMSSQLRFGVP